MRIAIVGSHQVGKSALVDELAAALPGYAVIDEPYQTMIEDGHEFADPPSPEDFEAQLAHAWPRSPRPGPGCSSIAAPSTCWPT